MRYEIAFLLLFSVATAVAVAARRFRIPYTVALVLTGLVLGATHALEVPHLTKELLYAVFLPGLVFEAAFHLEFEKFWENKLAIHALALPGVVASIALTAAPLVPAANALHFVDGFEVRHALVFAALIAATDPIAVVGLFKSLGAPKRLAVLVEGESLLNDGTAIVLFGIAVAHAGGAPTTVASATTEFVRVAGLGALVGVAIGYLVSRIIQQIDDAMIEVTLTTIAAWGSFIAAEHFHFSGVISTVAAGLLCGNYATRTGMSPTTRVAVETFWEYVAFALNSIIFLLIGFEVHVGALLASWLPILVAYMAVMAGRAAMIYAVSALLWPTREKVEFSWSAVLTWGGLRGALSMVLVLGLPKEFPHRDLLVTMTFGVVIVSILVQGLTMGPLLRRLGLTTASASRIAYDVQRGIVRSSKAALAAVERMLNEGAVHADVAATLSAEHGRAIEAAEQKIRELHMAADELAREEARAARQHLHAVQKEALLEAHRKALLGDEALEQLLLSLDAPADESGARPAP